MRLIARIDARAEAIQIGRQFSKAVNASALPFTYEFQSLVGKISRVVKIWEDRFAFRLH